MRCGARRSDGCGRCGSRGREVGLNAHRTLRLAEDAHLACAREAGVARLVEPWVVRVGKRAEVMAVQDDPPAAFPLK